MGRGIQLLLRHDTDNPRHKMKSDDPYLIKSQGQVEIFPYCERSVRTTIDGFKYYIQGYLREKKINIGLDVYDAGIGRGVFVDSPNNGQCQQFKSAAALQIDKLKNRKIN